MSKHSIESAMSAAKISRYYVSAYTSALESTAVDDRLFASLVEQQDYFGRKLSGAKHNLRDSLFGARSDLAASLRRVTDADEMSAIETTISGIDTELAGLRP